MTDPSVRRLDEIRSQSTELENHYIDELCAGRLTRRDFLRRGSIVGLSLPTMGAILAGCGSSKPSASSAATAASTPKTGGILEVANQVPTAAVNPLTVTDNGGLNMLCQTGEFLILDATGRLNPALQPVLALSWKPNTDGTIWTFKLRPGVKFHDGRPMTADDVAYTFQQQCDPANAANALSAFKGILSPSGVVKVDPMTVAFHLETPVGHFPYLASSNTYNAIIVPAGTDFSKWQSTFIGTGPWTLKNYSQGVQASFSANPSYWGPKPFLSGSVFKFYSSQPPQVLALQGGDVDAINSLVVAGAEALLNNPQFKIVSLPSSLHRELSMRTDLAPFTDARVRRAMALTLNRPALVEALLHGYGHVGNDSPFAPIFQSTDPSVPQRVQDLPMAKQLLTEAGHPNGVSAPMYTEIYQEIPELAQAIVAEAAKAGFKIDLKIEAQSVYYGKATFGQSDWLDGTMSLLDYGGRGVPNVVLQATLTSGGVWNAARFHNKEYDTLVSQYVAALDLQTQRQIAGKIQTLLLEETPVIIPYFLNELNATKSTVHGVFGTQNNQIFLSRAYMT